MLILNFGGNIINYRFRVYTILAVFLFVLFFCCSVASAAIINVNNETPNAIKSAISSAQPGDTINLSAGIYKEHDITITQNITIQGPKTSGIHTAIIDGERQNSVFKITILNAHVSLRYLTIQNGYTIGAPAGGGIYNEGILTINMCNIKDNEASDVSELGRGGGIFNNGGTVTMMNSVISGNIAQIEGGGIYNQGTFILSDSSVEGNSAGEKGGGIFNNGPLSCIGCDFVSNSGCLEGPISMGSAVYNKYFDTTKC